MKTNFKPIKEGEVKPTIVVENIDELRRIINGELNEKTFWAEKEWEYRLKLMATK